MKFLLNIISALCLLIGIVWILQGINILPGSFMTGQIQWAYYGTLLVIVGSAVLLFNNGNKSKPL